MDIDVTAIVPIKSDSERLSQKNFREFNGRPLYHWIIETLENVDEIDKIIINTDAEKVIRNAAEQFEVEISVRPERLRNEEVTTNIIKYEVNRNDSNIYLHTYATNPLLTADTISDAIKKFKNSPEHDSLLPVTAHQKWFYDADFEPLNHDPLELERTQDMEPIYEDNSAIYIYTKETIRKTGHRLGYNPLPFEIDQIEAIDIDVWTDFKIAEHLHKLQTKGELKNE